LFCLTGGYIFMRPCVTLRCQRLWYLTCDYLLKICSFKTEKTSAKTVSHCNTLQTLVCKSNTLCPRKICSLFINTKFSKNLFILILTYIIKHEALSYEPLQKHNWCSSNFASQWSQESYMVNVDQSSTSTSVILKCP
jgi:hypothetical protein